MRSLIILLSLSLSTGALAKKEIKHGFNLNQTRFMTEENRLERIETQFLSSTTSTDDEIRPYAEYKDQGYLIFNDEFTFNSQEAKRGFLRHLPDSITPVVFTQNQSPEYIESIKERFSSYMIKNQDKLKIMYLKGNQTSFWTRDHIPVPMFYHDQGKDHFMVVDAKYYYDFEPDAQVANHFNALMWSHEYYFEGGNFVANDLGDCLVVDNERVNS